MYTTLQNLLLTPDQRERVHICAVSGIDEDFQNAGRMVQRGCKEQYWRKQEVGRREKDSSTKEMEKKTPHYGTTFIMEKQSWIIFHFSNSSQTYNGTPTKCIIWRKKRMVQRENMEVVIVLKQP